MPRAHSLLLYQSNDRQTDEARSSNWTWMYACAGYSSRPTGSDFTKRRRRQVDGGIERLLYHVISQCVLCSCFTLWCVLCAGFTVWFVDVCCVVALPRDILVAFNNGFPWNWRELVQVAAEELVVTDHWSLTLLYLTLPYLRGGQVVTPAQRWGRISSAQCATPM